MPDTATGTIGLGPLRPAPTGLPDPQIQPPTLGEAGDPFTAVRVIDLLARIERGRPVRIADIADRLNATYLDWLFPPEAVVAVAVQLQANWMADYRNSSGVVLEDGPHGPTLTLEGYRALGGIRGAAMAEKFAGFRSFALRMAM